MMSIYFLFFLVLLTFLLSNSFPKGVMEMLAFLLFGGTTPQHLRVDTATAQRFALLPHRATGCAWLVVAATPAQCGLHKAHITGPEAGVGEEMDRAGRFQQADTCRRGRQKSHPLPFPVPKTSCAWSFHLHQPRVSLPGNHLSLRTGLWAAGSQLKTAGLPLGVSLPLLGVTKVICVETNHGFPDTEGSRVRLARRCQD